MVESGCAKMAEASLYLEYCVWCEGDAHEGRDRLLRLCLVWKRGCG